MELTITYTGMLVLLLVALFLVVCFGFILARLFMHTVRCCYIVGISARLHKYHPEPCYMDPKFMSKWYWRFSVFYSLFFSKLLFTGHNSDICNAHMTLNFRHGWPSFKWTELHYEQIKNCKQ